MADPLRNGTRIGFAVAIAAVVAVGGEHVEAPATSDFMTSTMQLREGDLQHRSFLYGGIACSVFGALMLLALVAACYKSYHPGTVTKRVYVEVPTIQTVQKIVDIPQVEYEDVVLEEGADERVEEGLAGNWPEGRWDLEVPEFQRVQKAIDVPPIDFEDAPQVASVDQVQENHDQPLLGNAAQGSHDEDWHHRWRGRVLVALYLSYVACSIGIPLSHMAEVSCSAGFFWETHLAFGGVLVVTKLVELALYCADPGVPGALSVFDFFFKFVPSMLGYIDGYTDVTAISIVSSCDEPIAKPLTIAMMATFGVGVLGLQWLLVARWAYSDPSQVCLMKLVHMDALSSCVHLPEEAVSTWKAVNLSRTFGEDIPQAICQIIFCIRIKKNYFMLLSIAVSVGSSLKALRDAWRQYGLPLPGALEAEMVEEVPNFITQEEIVHVPRILQQKRITRVPAGDPRLNSKREW